MHKLLLILLVFALRAEAKEMTFSLEQKDLRPNFDLYQWIFADGDIVQGTAGKFKSFVGQNPELLKGATIILNSAGGSVVEGLELGDAIRELHYRTDVGVAGSAPMTRGPGLCLSACIYPYLGGEYRYLSDGSSIGIHRFRFEGEIAGSAATEASQVLSGAIVDFLNRSRVDSRFFPMLTQTPPDNISIISPDVLANLKIVTGDIYSEAWSFEVIDVGSYLKADQITERGENKLLFVCEKYNGGVVPVIMAMSELPDRDNVIQNSHGLQLFLDDKIFKIEQHPLNVAPMKSNG
jgi:hypothetical protein